MPELPEVETVVRDLRPALAGRTVSRVVRASPHPLRKPWDRAWEKALRGARFLPPTRRGKWIVAGLEDGRSLVCHLGMTGQLTVVPARTPRAEHTHLVFSLDDGNQLRFRDVRRFGSATLLDAPALANFFAEVGLGPEPWDLEPSDWRAALRATSRCIKAVLLDQGVIAGVGNIYADEALFEAKLHPAIRADRLTAREAGRLLRAVTTVLERAIERRGSSVRDYVDGSGARGGYQDEFRVYGRTGLPCPRCGTAIARTVLAGRSSHFCPRCQPPGG